MLVRAHGNKRVVNVRDVAGDDEGRHGGQGEFVVGGPVGVDDVQGGGGGGLDKDQEFQAFEAVQVESLSWYLDFDFVSVVVVA